MLITIPQKQRTQPLTVWLLPRHIEKLTMIRDTTGLSFGQLLRALIDQAEVSEEQQDDNECDLSDKPLLSEAILSLCQCKVRGDR